MATIGAHGAATLACGDACTECYYYCGLSEQDLIGCEKPGTPTCAGLEGLGDPLFAKAVPWHNQLATSTGHVALRTYFALCLWSENQ